MRSKNVLARAGDAVMEGLMNTSTPGNLPENWSISTSGGEVTVAPLHRSCIGSTTTGGMSPELPVPLDPGGGEALVARVEDSNPCAEAFADALVRAVDTV